MNLKSILFSCLLVVIFFSCNKEKETLIIENEVAISEGKVKSKEEGFIFEDFFTYVVEIDKDVKIKNYFTFLNDVVENYNSLVPYELSEHILVRANSWIIDSLVSTDYYSRMDKGEFVYDQKELVILHRGDRIYIPSEQTAKTIISKQSNTNLDVNIPAFVLQIIENEKVIYELPIRVGQNKKRYLEIIDREEDLRTRTGRGHIYKINRNPVYVNPVDDQKYVSTLRDDGRRTRLPKIPFLHTIIDGHRWGQLIHPTTNQKTLGKAYSNGCIGTKEGDAWLIYYYAPVGTEINIRYDLVETNSEGDTSIYNDIYK